MMVCAGGQVTLTIAPALRQLARVVAEGRMRGKENCPAEQSRGGQEKDTLLHFYGALGEIVVIHAMEEAGIACEDYIFLAERAISQPDFLLNGVRFDIKSVPKESSRLLLTERARIDPRKACDFYLPVHFPTDAYCRLYAPIPHSDTGFWQLQEGRFEPYRATPVKDLRPLRSLSDIVMASLTKGKK